jgi:putative flippase GtrA
LRQQLFRYLVVGASGYVLAMTCYAISIGVGVPPYPAIVIAFVLNGAFNFTFFRLWAFPSSGRDVDSELRRFCVVALGSLAVNYASFALLYSVLGIPAVPAQAMAIVVATPVGFLANRSWSFRSDPAPASAVQRRDTRR